MNDNKLIRNTYLTNWFFLLLGFAAIFFIVSFIFNSLFFYSQMFLALVIGYLLIDILILNASSSKIEAVRIVKDQLNLGDENLIKIKVKNNHSVPLKIKIIDEIPYQFQIRDFVRFIILAPEEEKTIAYHLRPVKRGEYAFGALNIFVG